MNTLITDRATLAVSPALHKRAMDSLKVPHFRNPFQHLVRTPSPAGELPLLRDAQIRERLKRIVAPLAKTGMKARFKLFVLDAATKRVVREDPWRPNLILDQGMNRFATSTLAAQWGAACAVGTGSTPTVRDSTGTAQITIAGTACTSDAPFFEAGDAGRLLLMDSGQQAYIQTFNTNQSVTLATAPGDTGPGDGAIWYVNQTGLTSESKRTSTYLTGAGNTGSSDSTNTRTYKWTYDFSAEVAPQNYTELGWSNSGSAGNNLNSRALISGGSVAVGIGQQLRIIYEIEWTDTANTSAAVTTTVTGWPVAPSVNQDGDMIFNNPFGGSNSVWSTLSTTGSSSINGGLEPMSPAAPSLNLGTGSTLPTFGNDYVPGTEQQLVTANDAYVSGSFRFTRTGTLALSSGNRTDWRGLCLRSGSGTRAMTLIWDQNQTKANTHTLSLTWGFSWSRVLTNP